jgi:class 3 adenylate cyclase
MDQRIHFCTASDGVRIAYATVGEGPPLVKAANWLNHLEFDWRSPVWLHWLKELSRHHMLVRYDERGCGLSDWQVEDFSFQAWVCDLETVVDSLGLEHFPLLGISQGCAVAVAYAVRHPERVERLVLYGGYARGWAKRRLSPEMREEYQAVLTLMRQGWARDNPAYRQIFTTGFIPGATAEQMRWFNDLERISASPDNAVRFMTEFGNIDVDDLLPLVRVPTLVVHARGDLRCPFDEGRRMAASIPGARFVPLEGENHLLLPDEPAWPVFLREVRGFLGVEHTEPAGSLPAGPPPVTILFTDVEGSSALTHRLGDAKARKVLREHESIVRGALKAHGGSEVKAMGDGFMASFASASQALKCAVAMQRAFAEHNQTADEPILVRMGLNAGEPIAEAEDLFGTAVNLAARIAAQAAGGQIVVSSVVRELAAGKGFLFSDQGEAALRSFEDPVRLYEVRWES